MRCPAIPFALSCVLACVLAGCPRHVGGDDGGPGQDDGHVGVDSGYDPVAGNGYDGAVIFDEERVRAVEPSVLRAGPSPCRAPVLARIYRITDGDTIWARGDTVVLDASIRMIGIDTPEVARPPTPGECFGNEASAFTGQLLDRLVWLTFDSTCFDPYDRLLAYVHVGAGEGDLWERQLLRRGFATVMTVGDNRAFSTTFQADQASASAADVGLWSVCR